MTLNTFTISVFVLGLSAVQASSQDIYGSIGLNLNNGSVERTDIAGLPKYANGVILNGFVGKEFNNGYFIEGEARLQETDAAVASDALSSGRMIALRAGRDFGVYDIEGFVGYVTSENDNDGTNDRYFIGLGGIYRVNQKLSLNGLLGYLDGTGGTDDNGLDGMSKFTHVALGMNYQFNNRFGMNATVSYGDGVMDDDVPRDEAAIVKEFTIGGTYQFNNPAWSAYANLAYADLYQGGERDSAIDKRINIGVNWSFGNRSSQRLRIRPAIPNYASWLAVSGGILE